MWVVNTRFSCLCTLDRSASFAPRWRPPFVSALEPTDRCHLNGLGMVDGRPRYVTALGETDEPAGWRANKAKGGVLMDVDSGEVITRGLSMPHSPRWYAGRLWVCESGAGTFGYVDLNTGKYEPIAAVPGFTRGLDFAGNFAFVGLSQVRESAVFSGIPITERLAEHERTCGVCVIDLRTGQVVALLRFETAVQEVFAVTVLPGRRYPELINDDDDAAGEFLRGPHREPRRRRGDGPCRGGRVTPLPLSLMPTKERSVLQPVSGVFMTMPSWLRPFFPRSATRPLGKAPRCIRLGVEVLEDRRVPSTFTVLNTLDNTSPGSLRWAVGQANANTGADTIVFDTKAFAKPQTITLTAGQLKLSNTATITISGPAAGVTISGNNASEVFAIDQGATAALSNLNITKGNLTAQGGSGGGLSNSGTLALTSCTISGNTAAGGGGLYNSGTATLTNCTVSGNSATSDNPAAGGGVSNTGILELINCTVSGNSATSSSRATAGGIFNLYATMTLTNTIVAGNTSSKQTNTIGGGSTSAPSGYGDLDGPVSFVGNNNLIGDYGSELTNVTDGNLVGVASALLGPLGNYGGPTPTMPLLPGSPAIDAGAAGRGVPTTDQRGAVRVGAIDIGAFESQGFTFAVVSGSTPQTANIGAAFTTSLAVTVKAKNAAEPVNGGVVQFSAKPAANGATAIFVSPSVVITKGQAAVVAEPNDVLGNYTAVATSGGLSASFSLTNTGKVLSTLVVNTTSDSIAPGAGLLSLREAIAFAATAPSANSTITFDPTVFAKPQTITLTGRQLELSRAGEVVTITGPAAGVTVSGGKLSRVLQVDAGVTAAFSKLTLTGGSASYGGGLINYGTAALSNCTVSGNSASGSGGGLDNYGTAQLTLTSCTVTGNSAKSSGGGLDNYGTAKLILTNCTVSGNAATTGGGLYNSAGGTATLTNCTVSGNSATGKPSDVVNGAGLYNDGTSTLTLSNTIVAGNTSPIGSDNISGNVSGKNNLIGTGSSGSLVNGSNGNIVGVANALLAPLGNYGGPTQTMPLLPGSPAIDAGATGSGVPTTDQRGSSRFGAVDIGAFESQGFTFTAVHGGTPQTANIGTAFTNPLAVTVTAKNSAEPVNGGVVQFTAKPAANGATAILVSSSFVIAKGQAAVVATPNDVLGGYTVVATSGGLSVSFSLTNAGKVMSPLVVNTTSDSIVPGTGLPEPARGHRLRQHGFLQQHGFLDELGHHLRSDRLRQAANDHPDGRPARAEPSR